MVPSLRRLSDSLRNALPEGRSLPERVWRRRHTGLVVLLWLHAAAVTVVALARGYTLPHSAFEAGVLILFATVASNPRLGRRVRSMASVAGLVSASAVLVHLSSGNIEMHFHFFVMVVLIGLYQDWVPFLLAIGYVVIHHGTIGVLDPGSVYNHPGAIQHPWLWAGIHGAFIMGESIASMIAWRLFETAHGQAQSILESAGEGIFGVDTKGNVTFSNSAAASMLGMTPEEMVGREMYPLTHGLPDDADAIAANDCPVYASFREGTARHEVGDAFTRKDGSTFPVEYTSTPIRERGRIMGAVIAMRDVSVQQQLEEQLRQSQKMEAVGQLAGGVAHDFNNILGVIINNAEFLKEDLERGAASADDVDEISHAAERAAKLVGQLLAFARKEVLNPVVLSLNDAVRDMEKILRRTLRESIELRFELADDLWTTELDPSQVEQVVLNLAVNAGDAMPEGGKLTVQTRNVEVDEEFSRLHPGLAPGRSVCLTVSDTGLGMNDQIKQRIFEPFYTTKPRGAGTGLGLATVYAIVHRVGGYVGVYSEPGIGTSFTLYFPASTSPATIHQPAAAAVEGGHGETILVAEDEDALRDVVQRVLTRNGYTVLAAASGREALALLQEHSGRIDLLLTDVVMPTISGPALGHWVKEMHGEVPIMFMSGYPDDTLDTMGRARFYLQKPFTADALLAMVREALSADVPATSG